LPIMARTSVAPLAVIARRSPGFVPKNAAMVRALATVEQANPGRVSIVLHKKEQYALYDWRSRYATLQEARQTRPPPPPTRRATPPASSTATHPAEPAQDTRRAPEERASQPCAASALWSRRVGQPISWTPRDAGAPTSARQRSPRRRRSGASEMGMRWQGMTCRTHQASRRGRAGKRALPQTASPGQRS
jgi:hypothetical protein